MKGYQHMLCFGCWTKGCSKDIKRHKIHFQHRLIEKLTSTYIFAKRKKTKNKQQRQQKTAVSNRNEH